MKKVATFKPTTLTEGETCVFVSKTETVTFQAFGTQ